MKRFIPIIVFVVLVLCVALVPTFLNGTSGGVYLPKEDKGYEITSYNVDISVKNDGSFNVSEKITAHFYTGDTHGIYRWLPLVQTSTYKNPKGKLVKKNFRATVSNVSYNYGDSDGNTRIVDRFSENGNYFLQMGSDYFVPAGEERTYAFSYNYNFGDDRDKSFDMLYYNIIGTGWDTSISNLNFSITLPKPINAEGLEFYVGRYGESAENSNRVAVQFDDESGQAVQRITGSIASLKYGEAVTVFKALKQGYFDYEKAGVAFDVIILIIAAVIVIALLILFIKRRKREQIVEVVEFSAPEGLTPTEAGYINDGKITGDDISSLIVYWASKGFVRLEEESKDKLKIFKLATEEQINTQMKEHEQILFRDMFRKAIRQEAEKNKQAGENANADVKEYVYADNLDLELQTGFKCQKSVEKEDGKYFDKRADRSFSILLGFTCVLAILYAFKNIYQSVLSGVQIIYPILFVIVSCCGAWFLPQIFMNKDKWNKKKFIPILILDLVAIFVPIIVQMFIAEAYVDTFGARFYLVIIPIIMALIYPRLDKYTAEGKKVLGRVRGLRNYILVAEKDKMEMLVKDNPSLFYSVLPYAYVLGVSDVFMKKFEDVEIVQPEWYTTSNSDVWVAFIIIDHCMNPMAITMRNNITKNVASQVGKSVGSIAGHISSGGGGFSGGGHGGGGGGRW